MPTPEGETLVILVGELPEAMRFTGDPEAEDLLSDRFGGAWFGARHDGAPAIAFGLVDLTKSDASPLTWYLRDAPDDLVASFIHIPHLVAVVPSDAPGIEAFGHDDEGTIALMAHATIVEVTCRLRSLERLALSRASGRPPATEDLVNLDDPDAVRAALAPVHSRVARATGEMLTDNQVVPMAWRPWHYDLIAAEHRAALHWRWPVIQIFFELEDPTSSDLEGIAAPDAALQGRLRSYLTVVQRLARSMALNSGGSVSHRWGRDEPAGTVEVDAPHDDALAALLPHFRQLFDAQEGSGLSFAEMLKALSASAHAAGLVELVAELKRWKKAHSRLRRTHIGALQHQLAEELAGESLGEPHRGFPGMPEMSPEQLIAIFMYGETLHRDAEKAAQVEAWDSDPLLGPLMRHEVRADAQAFVHFYGAFAGYVARWLEVADAQVAAEGEAADADGERGVVRRQAPATRAGLRLRAGVADARFRVDPMAPAVGTASPNLRQALTSPFIDVRCQSRRALWRRQDRPAVGLGVIALPIGHPGCCLGRRRERASLCLPPRCGGPFVDQPLLAVVRCRKRQQDVAPC